MKLTVQRAEPACDSVSYNAFPSSLQMLAFFMGSSLISIMLLKEKKKTTRKKPPLLNSFVILKNIILTSFSVFTVF